MIDPVENERATALEIAGYGHRHGVDLDPLLKESVFQEGRRWIFLWRKLDGLPGSGRAEEKEGTLKYNMQGAIGVLPSAFSESARAFRGAWTEAGTVDGVEEAFALVKAWLLDGKEVDDLPRRHVRRCGI